ncbi:MAG: hypothetical protein LBH01_10015 [Verrucomicrobiales bacterium]|jgi:hypothetical protein|nr:hypothetical protein [Verrucomicrobiales bacterium]
MSNLRKLQKFLPVGALGISLILHLAIFLGISGIIIIQAVAPKVIPTGDYAQQAPTSDIPPPPEVPDEQPSTPNPATQEDAALDAPQTPSFSIDQISSASASSAPAFTIAPPSALPINSGATQQPQTPEKSANTEKRNTAPRTMSNPFGGNVRQEDGAVMGTMYDLKQTADRKPSSYVGDPNEAGMNSKNSKENEANNGYHQFLTKFVEGGWNENSLNGFYKVEKPIGAFQLFIPRISADDAPKAFNAERYVKPKRWVIIYRGSFTAPADGTYRFVGICDDILVVRLKNQNVLDGSLGGVSNSIPREKIGPAMGNTPGGTLWAGSWFQLVAGQTYPIQIMIGEQPGGVFYAFLLIEKKGEEYQSRQNKDWGPMLPVFQLAPTNMPRYDAERTGPAVSKKAFICQ